MSGQGAPKSPGADDPGAALRQAREGMGLNAASVASALHLDEATVIALEEGRYDDLPRYPFLQGYVRAYARHVGLDEDALSEQLAAVHVGERESTAPPVAAERTPLSSALIQRTGLLFAGVAAVVLLVALAVMLFAWQSFEWADFEWFDADGAQESLAPPPAPPPAPAERFQAERFQNEALVAAPANPDPPGPVAEATEDVDGPVPGLEQAAEALAEAEQPQRCSEATLPTTPDSSAPGGEDRLVFRVNQERSWLQVNDSAGVHYQGLGCPGGILEVDGTAPFDIVIGYAHGVEVSFNGEPVTLGPHTQGNVARLAVQ